MTKIPQNSRWTRTCVPAALCLATLLAACAQGNSTADLAPTAPQTAAQAPAPPPKGAMTPEEAKTQCWMKYEGDKKIKNIDQRLALVEKCVDETMRGQLVQAPQR